MAKKTTAAAKYGAWIGELVQLFQKADRKKLEAAMKAKDLKKTCEALGTTEKELKAFYAKGAKFTKAIFGDSLAEVVSAFKKSIK